MIHVIYIQYVRAYLCVCACVYNVLFLLPVICAIYDKAVLVAVTQ